MRGMSPLRKRPENSTGVGEDEIILHEEEMSSDSEVRLVFCVCVCLCGVSDVICFDAPFEVGLRHARPRQMFAHAVCRGAGD